MEIKSREQNSRSQKTNYNEKNLEYIEKIKEKKQREIDEKTQLQRRQAMRRENLRRKILQQARQNRESRKAGQIEDQNLQQYDSETTPTRIESKRHHGYGQSLPKISPLANGGPGSSNNINDQNKKSYKERYMSFLHNLHQNVKSKKEIEQQQRRKQDQQYIKMKEELGFDKVESKVGCFRRRGEKDQLKLVRSHSAQKFDEICQKEQIDMLPRTNKNFKRKNQEYLEKIKRRRQDEVKLKQQESKKKQQVCLTQVQLKEKLKDFVLTTVKKNVLDGVYDEEIVDKNQKRKNKVSRKQKQSNNKEKDQNGQNYQQEGSESEEQTPDLKKKKRKMRSFPHVTDLNEWKRKNRLESQQKVFIVTGGYPQLKKALRERGWVQNPDVNSPCFDLKYTLQGRQIDHDRLHDFQIVNHYQKNSCITTKIGLTKSLRSLIWISDTSEDNFYPKCFDLNDQDDNIGFEIHFKLCKALSILKIYVDFMQQKSQQLEKDSQKQKSIRNAIEDLKLRTQVALNVCRKNVQDVNDLIDMKQAPKIVTDKEWQILSQDELNEESLAKKKHQQWLKSIDAKYNSVGSRTFKKEEKKEAEKKKKKVTKQSKKQSHQTRQQKQGQQAEQQEPEDPLYEQVKEILQIYEKKYAQYHLTGHNNIWILKPAGLSRGRGITCYNNLVEIQDHIKCKESQWIAQKYIQNPLVILRRKFDIRQWVMVTDFNPLTIWMYQQSYIRFSAHDYNAKQVSNKFIHLTNNAIGSTYKDVKKSHIKGNMFFKEEFVQYLKELEGYDVYQEKIKSQIKEIVKLSLMCAVETIENRKNSHELFGYDFMVDTDYKVWLIEINSSPSMDYSTHITSKLVKECLKDTVKVIVDYHQAPKKEKKHIETGSFKKIYKGIEIPEKPVSTGLNLCLQGAAIKKPKKNFVKVQNFSLDNKEKK